MAKIHMTRKEINRIYRRVYRYNYSTLYPIYEPTFDPIGYNSGVYGWNYNVFHVASDICILSGDRGTFGERLPERAEKILQNAKKYFRNVPEWSKREKYIKVAKRKFIKALTDAE
jgi:hypothetical protein